MHNVINLSEYIAPIYKDYINSFLNKEHKRYIASGGRISFKSFTHEHLIALQCLIDPYCDVIVCRENYIDHRKTTFSGLIQAFERLGVKLQPTVHYPIGKTTAMYIRVPNGAYIDFKGDISKGYEKVKGSRPSRLQNAIKIVWFFEITEFKDDYGMEQIISSFVRGDKDYFINIFEYNPYSKRSHWTYEWIKKQKQRKDTTTINVNYNDHPEDLLIKWAGKGALEEILTLKEIDEQQYKSIYLGLPANLSGTIYKKFDDILHTGDINYKKSYQKLATGVDTGEVDATVFTLIGIHDGYSKIDVIDTWYHKEGVSVNEYDINDRVVEFYKWTDKWYSKLERTIEVYVESADPTFQKLLENYQLRHRKYGVVIEQVKKAKKKQKSESAIKERIAFLNLLLGSNAITIDKRCKELIKAIIEAEYNKHNDRLDDKSTDIDSLDSLEYAFLEDLEFIEDVILAKGVNVQ